jgi:hypothetical protein
MSEQETLFNNDSSVREYYNNKFVELAKIKPTPNRYLCQEPGCFKAFSTVS